MRGVLALGVKAAISAGLIYLALRSVDLEVFVRRLNQLDPLWLVAALLLMLAQIALVAARWREVAIQAGVPFPFRKALRYSLISAFFTQTLPSTVGGDAARIWLMARDGAGWRKATYSVIADRTFGMLSLAMLVVVCLPWTLQLVQNPTGRVALLLIAAGTIAVSVGFLMVGLPFWRRFDRFWAVRQLTGMAQVAVGALVTPRAARVLIPASLAIHLVTVTAAWMLARAAGVQLDFLHTLFLLPPVLLVSVVPISIAGWGVREGAMMAAFGYAGLGQADGLIVSLLFGITVFIVGAIGGLVWIISGERLGFGRMMQGNEEPARGAR